MKAAAVAALDPRFYQHQGVDWTGGVTITERYVRNYRLHVAAQTEEDRLAAADRRAVAGLRIARAALSLEARMSKDDILAGYLNTVFLGHGAHGVDAACRTYWGTTPDRLTIPQAALLAGMADDPETYDPVAHPQAAVERRNAVIAAMIEFEMITGSQQAAAEATSLGVLPG